MYANDYGTYALFVLETNHEQSGMRLSHIQHTAITQFYTLQFIDKKRLNSRGQFNVQALHKNPPICGDFMTYNADQRNLYKKEHRHSK